MDGGVDLSDASATDEAAEALAAAHPGTTLLEYAVGSEKTWLFVVQPAGAGGSGLSVFLRERSALIGGALTVSVSEAELLLVSMSGS